MAFLPFSSSAAASPLRQCAVPPSVTVSGSFFAGPFGSFSAAAQKGRRRRRTRGLLLLLSSRWPRRKLSYPLLGKVHSNNKEEEEAEANKTATVAAGQQQLGAVASRS